MNRSEVMTKYESFRDRCQHVLYDFYFPFRPYHLVSCCGWGPVITSNYCYARQQIYFGTRADEIAVYNKNNNQKWLGGAASVLALAEVDLPRQGYQMKQPCNKQRNSDEHNDFQINQANLLQFKGMACKLQVKKILVHPGEINSF